MKNKLMQCLELHNIFLNINLQDKVSLQVEGNDSVCFRFSYYLKKPVKHYHMECMGPSK